MKYDLIIIGSSPACLIHALKEKSSGKSVAVIDNSKRIGGVWKKIYTDFGNEFELGPHLIANNPDAYRYIEESLGCKMLNINPDPNIMFFIPALGFMRLNWRLRFLYFIPLYVYILLTGKSPARRKSIWQDKICNTMKETLFLRNINFQYPRAGSQAILDALEKKMRQQNIDIILDTHIEKIENQNNQVIINTKNTLYEANKILLTSNSHGFQLIDAQSDQIPLEYKLRTHHIAYMKLKSTKRNNISYTQFYTDRTCIKRVQDVTPYQNHTNSDEVLLVIDIKDPDNNDTDRLQADLKKLRIIDKSASLVNCEYKTYRTQNLEPAIADKIKQEVKNIDYLDTSDLAVNLSEYSYQHRAGAI